MWTQAEPWAGNNSSNCSPSKKKPECCPGIAHTWVLSEDCSHLSTVWGLLTPEYCLRLVHTWVLSWDCSHPLLFTGMVGNNWGEGMRMKSLSYFLIILYLAHWSKCLQWNRLVKCLLPTTVWFCKVSQGRVILIIPFFYCYIVIWLSVLILLLHSNGIFQSGAINLGFCYIL